MQPVLMLQAALLDCQFLDLLSFPDNGFVAPEVDVSWCDEVQATRSIARCCSNRRKPGYGVQGRRADTSFPAKPGS